MTDNTAEMRKAFLDVIYGDGEHALVDLINERGSDIIDKAIAAAVAVKSAPKALSVPPALFRRLAEVVEWRRKGYCEMPALNAYVEEHLGHYGDGALRAAEDRTLMEAARLLVTEGLTARELFPVDVEWVVNDFSELGVKIGERLFFLYKGDSYRYDSTQSAGGPFNYRPVEKREFGETCKPVDGAVSIEDGHEWYPMPRTDV